MVTAQCKAITEGGIYDYTYVRFDSEHASAFIDWQRTHKEATHQEAKSQGFGLAVPIDEVLVGANYSSDESGYRRFVEDIDSFRSGSSSARTRLETSAKTINTVVTHAIEKCLAQPGLHVWLETTPDPNQFHLAAVFHSPGDPLERTRVLMDSAAHDCLVSGYEALIPFTNARKTVTGSSAPPEASEFLRCLAARIRTLCAPFQLPDADDRHVLAAAIVGRCDVIVTQNLKDFPDAAPAPYGIIAQHPDEFLYNNLNFAQAVFCSAVQKVRRRLQNPPYTIDEYFDILTRQGLVVTTAGLKPFSDLL